MRDYESDLLEILEILDYKYDILSIIHNLQFDGVYDVNHCLEDLSKLLIKMEESEPSFKLIQRNYKVDTQQQVALQEASQTI